MNYDGENGAMEEERGWGKDGEEKEFNINGMTVKHTHFCLNVIE